jgi:hypothetical protein
MKHDPQGWKGEHLIRAPKREPAPIAFTKVSGPHKANLKRIAEEDAALIRPLAKIMPASVIARELGLTTHRVYAVTKAFGIIIEAQARNSPKNKGKGKHKKKVKPE